MIYSPAAKGGDPIFSDIGLVFDLLIMYILDLDKDIQGGVKVFPLINFNYSR